MSWKTITYRAAVRVLPGGGSRTASVLPDGRGGWSVVGVSSRRADLAGILDEHRHALLAAGTKDEAERVAEQWVATDDEPGEPCPCSDEIADRIVDALPRKPAIGEQGPFDAPWSGSDPPNSDDVWERIVEEHGPFAEEMNAAAREPDDSLVSLDDAVREVERLDAESALRAGGEG